MVIMTMMMVKRMCDCDDGGGGGDDGGDAGDGDDDGGDDDGGLKQPHTFPRLCRIYLCVRARAGAMGERSWGRVDNDGGAHEPRRH